MGLLLSVLITCIGVLEVVTFYTNFNIGVTYQQYKTDLTDVARNYAWELRRNHLHHLFPDGDPEEEFSRMLETHRSRLASTRSIAKRPKLEDDEISLDEDSTYDQISEIDNEITKYNEIFTDKSNEIVFVSGPLEKEFKEAIAIEDLPKDEEETTKINQKMENHYDLPKHDFILQKEDNPPRHLEEKLVVRPSKEILEILPQEIGTNLPKHVQDELIPHHPKEPLSAGEKIPSQIEKEIIPTPKQNQETTICSPILADEMKSFLDQLESQIVTDDLIGDLDKVVAPTIKQEITHTLESLANPGEIIEELCVQTRFMDLTDKNIEPEVFDISNVDLSSDLKEDIVELAQERLLDIGAQILPVNEKKAAQEVDQECVQLIKDSPQPIVEEPVHLKETDLTSQADQECAQLAPSKQGEVFLVERIPSPYPMSLFGLSTDNGITDLVVNEDFLRSLDGVKPTKCDDRRRSFRKKRNSSSSSKDRASRDRSNTSVDSNENRTERDLKEIEAMDALAEKNGSFEENYTEIDSDSQNHELKTISELETAQSSQPDILDQTLTVQRNENDHRKVENVETIPDRYIPRDQQTFVGPEQTKETIDSENSDTVDTKGSITIENNLPREELRTSPDTTNGTPQEIDLDQQLKTEEPFVQKETAKEETKLKLGENGNVPLEKNQSEKMDHHAENAQESKANESTANLKEKNYGDKVDNNAQMFHVPKTQESGLVPTEQRSSCSEESKKELPILEEVVKSISKIVEKADHNQVDHNEQTPKEFKTKGSALGSSLEESKKELPVEEKINKTEKLTSKMEQNVNNILGKDQIEQIDQKEISPETMTKESIPSCSLEESKRELAEEVKKAQTVHKIEETITNSGPNTLAQEASAKLSENRRKFLKASSVNSFEDASSSQNDEINKVINNTGQNDSNTQRTATTISLPNSDAFWVMKD